MNYIEQHIGDYMKATAHLTMVEDGAYRRLLDAYYTREFPLPADIRACCKLARTSNKAERTAVTYILSEFFSLKSDGHHQKRADQEIEKYHETLPDREARKESNRERQRRSRKRRADLFLELRAADIVPPYDATTAELQSLLSRVTKRDVTVTSALHNAPVASYNTANQAPVSRLKEKALSPPLEITTTTPPSEHQRAAALESTKSTAIDPSLWHLFEQHQTERGKWSGARSYLAQGQCKQLATQGVDVNAVLTWAINRGLADLIDCHQRMQADAAKRSASREPVRPQPETYVPPPKPKPPTKPFAELMADAAQAVGVPL